jgi:hypothetical protein
MTIGPITLSLTEVSGLERLLSSTTAFPWLAVPPNLRDRLLADAQSVFGKTTPKPIQAALAPIAERTQGYLFRFPHDPELYSRLVAPARRAPSAAFQLVAPAGYPQPLLVALYSTIPETSQASVRHFLRLSALFSRVPKADAYGEILDVVPENLAHQALLMMLGATEMRREPKSKEPKEP